MSEMVERVAGALWPWLRRWMPDLGIYGDSQEKTDQAVDRCWPFCSAQARAAIEAMREPTPGMVGAANRNNHPRDIDTWQTMIDAALGEQR
jgi:hypothetical protein